MSKEIRGFSKEQLEIIKICLNYGYDISNDGDNKRCKIMDIIKRIDKQLKEWNGVKDDKEK